MKINDIVVERAEDPRSEVKRREQFRTGGGTHKDRKKAAKRGEAKHKKQAVPMEGADKKGMAESDKNPFDNPLGKALWRDLSKVKKLSPQQVQRNKDRWAQRQAKRNQGVTEGSV